MALPVGELLESFAAPTPTPGGGSAAALSGALGAALLAMVASLSKTRHGTDEDARALGDAARALNSNRARLQGLVEEDSKAYEAVMGAYRHPKDDADRRRQAIQEALRRATDVPLEVMRLAGACIREGIAVARHGNPSASSDVGVGRTLLEAAFEGAALNVRLNLQHVRDGDYLADVNGTLARLETEMKTAASLLRDALTGV